MKKLAFALAPFFALQLAAAVVVRTDRGKVEGTVSADSKVRIFKGIPYAAPPVGALRWKAPQPAPKWSGVRKAVEFGARCMQAPVFPDMVFRDKGPSEDCLSVNVWAPAERSKVKLPVMVWIYGGGFVAGSSSEPRQDGENLAKKGVVLVSFNYRLGLFGFLSHPDLARESGRNASGNYGLLDQLAALEWVRKNIGAFGGDPGKVTIFGESAGSFSVSALMASPLAKGLFQRAIGESGAFFSTTLPLKDRAQTEPDGAKFAESVGATSIKALRAKPADELMRDAMRAGAFRFTPNIDGYFLPEDTRAIYGAGKQSHVPLLAGWNLDEGSYRSFFQTDEPTAANFIARARKLFGDRADEFLKLYPAENDAEAKRSAQDYAGDQFIAYSTWKWLEMQQATGGSPVYRYEFDQAPPQPAGAESRGAYHSAEIEYVFEALASRQLPWRPEDFKLSDQMSSYWTNFAKTGDPNGEGLPAWRRYSEATKYGVMHLSAAPAFEPDAHRGRYEFLDAK
jgi:para-nitrobenzyl esterase